MDILRQELIETQKARSELTKWKLLLVSALGATGLGFAESKGALNAEVLLCCIPFVCIYVDVQYANLSLRITGIATFFRDVGPRVGVDPAIVEYENLMRFARRNVLHQHEGLGLHSPQSWIVRTSSVLFSVLVAFYAVATFLLRDPRPSAWMTLSIFCSGAVGVAFDLWLFRHTRARQKIIEESGRQFCANQDKP